MLVVGDRFIEMICVIGHPTEARIPDRVVRLERDHLFIARARTIEIANRTYVMRAGGRIEFHGTAEELAQRGDFETAYIGMGG